MQEVFVFTIALVIALIATPGVRYVSLKLGHVARPQKERWHTKSTALHGGVAIFVAYVGSLMFFVNYDNQTFWILLLGSSLAFGLGLFDDLWHVRPYSKLIGQVVAACVVVGSGLVIQLSLHPIIGIFLTMFWIIGITNAFNLLDNMDGLSAGTGCIAAFCLALAGAVSGNQLMSVLGISLVGATLGFLFFNFPPAKIFMGDSGSLFLGFTLSVITLTGNWEDATNLVFAMLVPVLVFAVPIFDTSFVTLVRFFNGQSISKGGKDHTSHRLVAFGLPERTTVLFFYVMSMMCGAIALIGARFDLFFLAILLILVVIVLWYFGLFLSGIISYGDQSESRKLDARNYGLVLNLALMHKKRIGEVIVDCILIGVAFTLAYVIRFEGLPPFYLEIIRQSLPILIPLKLIIFFYFGLYRGLWRYVGMQDLINILKAVTASSVLAVVVFTMVFRFEGHSRAAFIIDWMVLLLAVGGIRVSIRLLREYLSAWVEKLGKNLLIVGAGDAGEIALREIKNNPKLTYAPMGFVDDDPSKRGREIHGIQVLGTTADLSKIVSQRGIDEILVAIPSVGREKLKSIVSACKETGVEVRVMPKNYYRVKSY